MRLTRFGIVFLSLFSILLVTVGFANAAPQMATSLVEGRNYDQAHDTGYIDWSGPVGYVYVTHRDFTSLPPEEGGGSCASGCQEWVTRIGSGGTVSGSFDRNVSYFEVMVEFTHDSSVGNATVRACGSVSNASLYLGSGGGPPGFVSLSLTVPAGCRSWSLSASGGYVDFRSVDVNYVAAPPTATFTPSQTPTTTPTFTLTPTATLTSTPTITNTPTLTFTPTFTPTSTATSTFTFTPTFTPTNTPSSTPTPLPPVINGQVTCDEWGDAGWCKGNEYLELTASDPQGFGVTIGGDLNGNSFACGDPCTLSLPEGSGAANYMVTSASGQTANGSSTWLLDNTEPIINVILPPVDGKNGWYLSDVSLSSTAADAISGLASLEGSIDGGVTWTALPLLLSDGRHSVLIHARDVAGNETVISQMVHVDTVPPVSVFSSHSDGDVVNGVVVLTGSLDDALSGSVGAEVSLDGGITWQAVSLDGGGAWSFAWNSGEVPNGEYVLQIRGQDLAGNVGDARSITLIVDNLPPKVSLTDRWWIWESGQLKVSANRFPIVSVKVKISDPEDRWPAVVMDLNPYKDSFAVSWDRRFADGTLAPAGEYLVLAVACDVNGLCGRDSGRIVIPVVATPTATAIPSQTATIIFTVSPSLTPTQIKATPIPVLTTPIPKEIPEPVQLTVPLWQILGLLSLFMVIASASVVDPRPKALECLGETFKMMSAQEKGETVKNQLNKNGKDK